MIRAVSFFAIILACGSVASIAQISAGYVVEVRGDWALNGGGSVRAAQKLPAGASIRRRSRASDDIIKIASLTGTLIADQNCAKSCSGIVSLGGRQAGAAEDIGIVRRILDAITGKSLLPSWRNRQARNSSLREGVLRLDGGEVDISSVLKREGGQFLKWRRIAPDESAVNDPVRLTTPILSGFSQGVYELTLVRSNGSDFEPVASSWVLISNKETFDADVAAFAEMKRVIDAWGDAVSTETKRSYLQATLRAIELDREQ